jgi:hypothetical protein
MINWVILDGTYWVLMDNLKIKIGNAINFILFHSHLKEK